MPITASGNIHGHELKDIEVINPGGWFGKCWLIEIGGSYSAHYLIVEADSMCDAIDELADNEKHGHNIVVEEDRLSDYDPDSCPCGPSGQVIDLDHLMIHGMEGCKQPFPCKYFGQGLPPDGIDPSTIDEYELEETV